MYMFDYTLLELMATALWILSAHFNPNIELEIFGLKVNWTLHFAKFNVQVGLEIARVNGNETVQFVC